MSTASPVRARSRLDRLTPLDASNLRVEAHGMPMHVAVLALLDGAPLLDPSRELRLDSLREHVDQRTHHAQRLRQVLTLPRRGLGAPAWVDDVAFDITRHVRTRRVPGPGDETSLLELCCDLNEPPLDRRRPLWEMWLLTGLADGRVGLLVRLHHVVADGVAAVALLSSLFDRAPDAPTAAAPPHATQLEPSAWTLFTDSVRDRRDAARKALAALGHPCRLFVHVAMWVRQAAALARQGRAPVVSLNRPVGSRRRLHVLRADLAAARAIAHRHGAKVNDVVLAALAGGARRILESRGELTPDLVLNVSVPASLRDPHEAAARGNRVGIRVVPVPVAEPNAVTRLETIAANTAEQRGRPPYQPSGRLLQRWMVRVMANQRMVNLPLSNLPGPPAPLYFAGARVQEMFQVGVLQGNLALAVGVLSYAGQLNFDIIADADAIPDLTVFAEGVREALEQLGTLPGQPVPT